MLVLQSRWALANEILVLGSLSWIENYVYRALAAHEEQRRGDEGEIKGRGEEVKVERRHAGPRNEEIFSLKNEKKSQRQERRGRREKAKRQRELRSPYLMCVLKKSLAICININLLMLKQEKKTELRKEGKKCRRRRREQKKKGINKNNKLKLTCREQWSNSFVFGYETCTHFTLRLRSSLYELEEQQAKQQISDCCPHTCAAVISTTTTKWQILWLFCQLFKQYI